MKSRITSRSYLITLAFGSLAAGLAQQQPAAGSTGERPEPGSRNDITANGYTRKWWKEAVV